jgi:sterol desaturase/sphingolipid hydroxylase (fatty acid hydroxylase superfamily)
MHSDTLPPKLVRYGLQPTLLAATLTLFFAAPHLGLTLSMAFAVMGAARLALLLVVEWRWPARAQWRMGWRSFGRDLKYMAINGGAGAFLRFGAGWLAVDLSQSNVGLLAHLPWPLEFLLMALTFELVQYGFHRYSHEGRGGLGRWLWALHAAHHLPDRVYLLMHPVAHPLNFVISLAIIQVPALLGASQETVFLLSALVGLQGLISHFNVDLRAGPLNFVLVGTELHRLHHSADEREAGNYGVLTPIWDLIFGTFRKPRGTLPVRLGVSDPSAYPHSDEVIKVLALPFR